MDRSEYCDAVLAALRRVTKRERAAIRAELEGHIEDHMECLLDLDYPPELAEARSLAAMGDPGTVGKELNRQYPLGWLVLGRSVMLLTLLLALLLARPLAERMPDALRSLQARWAPKTLLDISRPREDFDPLGLDAWDVDREVVLRDAHFRIYQIAYSPGHEGGGTRLAVANWRTNPFQEGTDGMYGYSLRVEVNGEDAGYGRQPELDAINLYSVWARPGDTLTLTWEVYGESGTAAIELPEVRP